MAGLASEMLVALQAHEEIFRYWKSLRVNRALPSRSDLDLVKIRKHLPTISLIDVRDPDALEAAHSYHQRLAGTGLYLAYGEEITGKSLDMIYPEPEASFWAEDLRTIVETRKPNVGLQSLAWRGVDGLLIFWLRLPLSNNGRDVDMILGHDVLIGKLPTAATGIRAA